MHFGQTLKKIRQNRALTQLDVCDGIMKQGTYSRIENGQLDIGAAELAKIVERLNISLNEFLFIHQNYEATPRQQLINDYINIELTIASQLKEKRKAVALYLQKHRDVEIETILYSYDTMIALMEQKDMDVVRSIAEKVWARLQKLDYWYMTDLEILNATIMYFPFETAVEVANTAIARIDAYTHFEKDLTYLKLYFKVNLSYLYLEEKRYEECLRLLETAQNQYSKLLTYQTLGFILTRIIICKHHLGMAIDEDWNKLSMLRQLFDDEEVFDVLLEELQLTIPHFKI